MLFHIIQELLQYLHGNKQLKIRILNYFKIKMDRCGLISHYRTRTRWYMIIKIKDVLGQVSLKITELVHI